MRRPGNFTFLAVVLAVLGAAALYFANEYAGGERHSTVMAILCLFYGLTAGATAAALWQVSRRAFPLSVAWSAAAFALLVGQQTVETLYGDWFWAALVFVGLAGVIGRICWTIRATLIELETTPPPAEPDQSS